MNMWERAGLPVVVACLVALTACGNGGDDTADDGAEGPESPAEDVTEPQEPTSDPVPEQPEDAESPDVDMPGDDAELVEGMRLENSVGWEDYEVVSETHLRFLTTSGNQSCYGQRYQIEETEDEVAVAIITGQREGGPDICTQEAVFIAVPVELNEPLGERDVVELSDPELNQ